MYYLYIIQSEIKIWRYIGITADVQKRVAEHNAGKVRSTKPNRPLRLVYKEVYPNKSAARKREIFLKKTAKARNEIFKNLHGPIV